MAPATVRALSDKPEKPESTALLFRLKIPPTVKVPVPLRVEEVRVVVEVIAGLAPRGRVQF